jgi:hypothetical protein
MRLTTWVRVVGTLIAAAAILVPLYSQGATGIVATIRATGGLMSLSIVGLFFAAVALYCRTLQRCLELIGPHHRVMRPGLVWLMYVPFYNITEDFFIVHAVTRSLRLEAQTNERLRGVRHFGAVSGFGWCTGQALALVPAPLGEVAGIASLALWVVHWVTLVRMIRMLNTAGRVAPT